ncbi:MAG: hypothetical protein WC788_08265 [Candidatus Paceibacterota bacterium]|jgi:hypothetical protein
MEKKLTRIKNEIYHFDKDDKKIVGAHSNLSGDVSGICGDVIDIYGNVSGIRGNVGGICGDVDDCEITEEDRNRGINISELIN